MELSVRRETLQLVETVRNSRLAIEAIDTCILTIDHEGVVAYGEGTAAGYDGETVDDVLGTIETDGDAIVGDGVVDPGRILARLDRWDAPTGARMAVDGAVRDWVAKSVGLPSWRLLGAPRTLARPTGYTIGLGDVDETLRTLGKAPAVGAFKVKVGGPVDIERLEAIRGVTALPMRVDANEAWDLDTARALTPVLRALDVHLVEQPFPAAAIDDYHRYRELPGRLPVFVDEGCRDAAGAERASAYADGIVVKLYKSGGTRPVRRVMEAGRRVGLAVMLSCMCESELAISQAAQLAPLADRIDLDGHFVLRDGPFRGLGLDRGRIVLGDTPGLGVVPSR
jgi:L-alanine-DL-glutamate epimerase-like enolase superfamily enzyme